MMASTILATGGGLAVIVSAVTAVQNAPRALLPSVGSVVAGER